MSEDRQVEQIDQEPDSARSPSMTARFVQETITSAVRSGPAYHPIFDKFEAQHVTQFLKDLAEHDAAKHRMLMGNRWFRLAYVGIAIIVFIFMTIYMLPEQSDLYFQFLQGVGLFVSGLAGGYGIRSYREKR